MKRSLYHLIALAAWAILVGGMSQAETSQVTPTEKALRAQSHFELARDLEKKKDWPKVIEALKPVSESLPLAGLLLLARAYRNTKDAINEVRVLELCTAKDPKNVQTRILLGEAYAAAKRSEDAIATFQEARKQDAKALGAYWGILHELTKSDANSEASYEARTLLHDMVKIFGEKPEFLNELCRLYAGAAYLEKAVEICTQAIDKDPRHSENYIYLGNSLRDQDEEVKAAKVYSDAAKLFPKSAPVLASAGEMSLARKDYPAAYKTFRQAVLADRKLARAVAGYAQASFELQKNQEALDAYIQACTLDRAYAKDIRVAISRLRTRKDAVWQYKYEDAIGRCP
jgi:tetratricopeptide (TPR) repeat protein